MNIILIMSDTFRYDNLFDRAEWAPTRTPCLEAFHQRAVSLDGMVIGSFPTIPQRTDLTSGRCGWPWYGWQALDKSTANHLPKMLARDAGYVTQLICDCPHLFNAGFQFGFDAAVQTRGQEGDKPFLHMNDPIASRQDPAKARSGAMFRGAGLQDIHRWTNATWQGEMDCFPPRTAGTAMRFLEQNYKFHPFFLWLDFFDPHEPWDPPEYLVRRYDPDYDGPPMIMPNYGNAADLTPAEQRNLRAHYQAEAELVDRWVGRVLQKIDDLQLWDNSIVIFTSDHGHNIGDRGRFGKTNINSRDTRHWPLYPEIARVPFLIAAPGLEGGRTLDFPAEPQDILPTLIDLAGLDLNPPEPLHGISFAPQLRGETPAKVREFAVSATWLGHWQKGGEDWQPGATLPVVSTTDWIFAPFGETEAPELYDRQADPRATTNVAADHPDVVETLHAALLAWLRDIDAPAHNFRALQRG